ncbi:uncharacterized protein BJX67DRAFT_62514 [Aspergillus lucknowensis]|uniref:Uncharacterized protein n=1 Tax=Aspergillus lucknowensis TaxID=176173 RepID=A0ABR4LUD7_9EURO
MSSSSSSNPTTFSSPCLYPSSCSSAHSVSLLSSPNLSSSSPSSSRPPPHSPDHLENLIARHGRPTRFSLSSLEELTSTYSTYNPPSPLSRPRSPVTELSDSFEKFATTHTRSKPIPIPRPSFNTHDEDIPVTPLTGRFERDYFPRRDPSPQRNRRSRHNRRRHTHRHGDSRSSRMRSDSSTFHSPVSSQPMSSSGRPSSPQPTLGRVQSTAKSAPTIHLGDLPRFHPAVYQSSGNSQAITGQPPSPRQSRQHIYRPGSTSRDPASQYRDFVEGLVLQKPPSRPLSPSPAAPRLNPLQSPGPVTPLALEDAGGYLSSGAAHRSELSKRDLQQSAPAPDLLDRLIARENEKVRQKARKTATGR